jgi:glycosyltransferase involved in cell wall biosynthesis
MPAKSGKLLVADLADHKLLQTCLMPTPVIAYISQQFPSLTMTFVYREVLALRRLGLRIRPIATWPPKLEGLSAEAQALVGETRYLFPLRWQEVLKLHVRYALTRPAQYFGALTTLTLFNRETPSNRFRSFRHFVYSVLVAAEVERCGADHIHADFARNSATLALVAAQLTGKPFSFAAHANDLFVNPLLLGEKVKAAAFATPISEFNRKYLTRFGDPRKLHVVHCGLDLQQFTPRANGARPARSLILAVGRLVEKKGFHYLVAACRRLAEQGLDFECQIIGGGPEEARLRKLIAEYGLQETVALMGPLPQEKVREHLQKATVFVLPCVIARDRDQDGIPVALMEAMAFEVPVVTTRLSGIPELVKDAVNGLLVPPADVGALADAVEVILHDSALAQTLALAGRRTVELEFNVEKSARQLAALFVSANCVKISEPDTAQDASDTSCYAD